MNSTSPSQKSQNSHDNSAAGDLPVHSPASLLPASSESTDGVPPKTLYDLVPPSVRDRRWRARSFASQLDPVQWSTLTAWLMQKGLSIEDVRRKVAAPSPEGFGMEVCPTTLSRLRAAIKNSALSSWIERSADIACDVLCFHDDAKVAPMHEALRTFLYSRALEFARDQVQTEHIDKVIAAIQRLERIRPTTPARSRESHPVHVAHQHVEVAIAQNAPAPSELTNQTVGWNTVCREGFWPLARREEGA